MKKRLLLAFLLISFIAISNVFSFAYIFFVDGGIYKTYQFITYDGKHQFSTMPHKGNGVKTMEYRFSHFCDKNPEYQNTYLYRTFRRNPLKYWRWYDFFTHPRYKYPYKKASDR